MKRRTLLKRIGAAGLAAGVAAGSAAAADTDAEVAGTGAQYHRGECHDASEDYDCILDDCTEVCPSKCCECVC